MLIALVLSAVFSVWSAAVFRRVLMQSGFSESASTLGMALFLFSPWSLLLNLSGMETALFFLLFFSYLRTFRKVMCVRGGGTGTWGFVQLGLAAGLMELARTDSMIIAAIGYFIILARHGSTFLRRALLLGASVSVNILMLLPWLLWNLSRFGSISQDSAWAISYWRWSELPSPLTLQYHVLAALRMLHKAAVLFIQPFIYRPENYWFPKTLDLLFAVMAGAFLVAVLLRRRRQGVVRVPVMLWLPALVILVFYAFVRVHSQVWHLSTLLPASIACLLTLLPNRPGWKCGALAAALLVPTSIYALGNGYYFPQQRLDALGFSLGFHADADSTMLIGNGDCGYLGYFSRHEIVNLDGTVNSTALRYIRAGRLQEYIDSMHFDEVYLRSMEPGRVQFYNRNM